MDPNIGFLRWGGKECCVSNNSITHQHKIQDYTKGGKGDVVCVCVQGSVCEASEFLYTPTQNTGLIMPVSNIGFLREGKGMLCLNEFHNSSNTEYTSIQDHSKLSCVLQYRVLRYFIPFVHPVRVSGVFILVQGFGFFCACVCVWVKPQRIPLLPHTEYRLYKISPLHWQ